MKKFEKIFFSMIAMIMMVAVGSVFTSCTNDDDDFPVPAQETQLDQALDQDSVAPMTRAMNSTGEVTTTRKNWYYNGHWYACSYNFANRLTHVVPVGFFAALNASHSLNYAYWGSGDMQYYCNYYSSLAKFKSYSEGDPDDEADFKSNIFNFVKNKQRPVAVTVKLDSGDYSVLIVWKVTDTNVVVTRSTDIPQTTFTNNYLITLSWDQLRAKAFNASNQTPRLANVGFMAQYIN